MCFPLCNQSTKAWIQTRSRVLHIEGCFLKQLRHVGRHERDKEWGCHVTEPEAESILNKIMKSVNRVYPAVQVVSQLT